VKEKGCDLWIRNVTCLVTVAGGPSGPIASPSWDDLGMIEGGALAAREGRIVAVGPSEEVEKRVELLPSATVLEGEGKLLLPGFVDPHTHFLFAGGREEEYALRVEGVDYLEIRRRGGGILRTVRDFRSAPDEVILEESRRRLDRIFSFGTTTIEGKSGYGLTTEQELRALRLMGELGSSHPIGVVPSFLGAHEIPQEYKGRKESYVDLVVEEMIPRVGDSARFCDVFCEEGVFSVEESRRILEQGKKHGLLPKLHAEEFVPIGGGELAAEVGAVSADHLLVVTEEGCAAIAESGTVAVLLPGTAIGLAGKHFADVDRFRRHGVPIALGTDCNPGSSYAESMAAMISLSCSLEGLTVPEGIVAATRNAAAAVALSDRIGTLEPGKAADCILLDAVHPASVPYRFATNLVEKVVKGGRMAWSSDQGFSRAGRNFA